MPLLAKSSLFFVDIGFKRLPIAQRLYRQLPYGLIYDVVCDVAAGRRLSKLFKLYTSDC